MSSYNQHGGPLIDGEEIDTTLASGDYEAASSSTTRIAEMGHIRWIAAENGGMVKFQSIDGNDFRVPIQSRGIIPVFATKVYASGTTASGTITVGI